MTNIMTKKPSVLFNYTCVVLLMIFSGCKKAGNDNQTTQISPAVATSLSLPQALFTEPAKVLSGQSSTIIMDKLISMIDATPEKEFIHISIYGFLYDELVVALKKADARGVKLRILIDMSRVETIEQNPPTVLELQKLSQENSEVTVVKSDAGSIAINHNKFAIFSKVITTDGVKENLVFQTSHNFTVADTRKVQDAVVISEKGLYDAYLNYWTDMRSKAASGMSMYEYKEYSNQTSGIYAYFLPKRKNGTSFGDDSIIEFLNALTNVSTATIKIGMSDWTATRKNIVDKLAVLQSQGAKIEVIAKSSIDSEILVALEQLRIKGAYVKVLNMTDNSKPKMNIHSKFMLLTGTWKGKENTKILITGSHNFTLNALRNNNETIVLLQDSPLFSSYENMFATIKTIVQ
jgi:phosphatidylserine/phosphatidylglycerophosphate/cardiolipin synthase-like enzyme